MYIRNDFNRGVILFARVTELFSINIDFLSTIRPQYVTFKKVNKNSKLIQRPASRLNPGQNYPGKKIENVPLTSAQFFGPVANCCFVTSSGNRRGHARTTERASRLHASNTLNGVALRVPDRIGRGGDIDQWRSPVRPSLFRIQRIPIRSTDRCLFLLRANPRVLFPVFG